MPESRTTRLESSTVRSAGPSGLRIRVIAAADAILRAGRRPTIEAIRQHLGAGSQTTLMAYLNDWYGELAERLAASETPLSGMPAEASQLLQLLWRVASKAQHSGARDGNAEANAETRMLEAERDSLSAQNKALETLNAELKAQRRNIERLLTDTRALLTRREAELEEERESRTDAEQNLARAALDMEVLRAQQSARRPAQPIRTSPGARTHRKPKRIAKKSPAAKREPSTAARKARQRQTSRRAGQSAPRRQTTRPRVSKKFRGSRNRR